MQCAVCLTNPTHNTRSGDTVTHSMNGEWWWWRIVLFADYDEIVLYDCTVLTSVCEDQGGWELGRRQGMGGEGAVERILYPPSSFIFRLPLD